MSVVRTLIGNVKGPKGDTGATGATGAQGDAATIQIGTVTTGAYGTNASVTNSGTEHDAVFDFVIPQGAPGEEVTDASNLTLNEITASSANYPTFTVQERLKGIFGKIQKFLSDLKTNYVSKSMMTTSTNIDTAGQAVADAKAIKSLNDSLANIGKVYTGTDTGNTVPVGGSGAVISRMTLPAGTYILLFDVTKTNSSNQAGYVAFYTTGWSAQDWCNIEKASIQAINHGAYHSAGYLTLNSQTNVELSCIQTAYNAFSFTAGQAKFFAIRVK